MDFMGLGISADAVSPAALCEARKAVGTTPFDSLHDIATAKHLERHQDLILHKGYRLYAVDGSNLTLHSNRKLARAFGRPRSTGKRRSPPQATFTVLELVNTGWITDYKLGRCNAGELAQSKDLTAGLGERDLLLADRLYFDPLWYADLSARLVKFLFRLNCNRYRSLTAESQRRITEQRTRGNVDCQVDLRVREAPGKKTYTILRGLRYIEIRRSGAQTLYFVTNLTVDELATSEAAELYAMRWEIETNLRYFKGQDHLPSVRSRRDDTVRQEVALHVLAHNSVRFIQSEACVNRSADNEGDNDNADNHRQPESDATNTPAKKWTAKSSRYHGPLRPVDIQFKRTVDIILGSLVDALLQPDRDTPQHWSKLLEKVVTLRIMVKSGRSYPRAGRKYKKGKPNKGNVKAQKRRAAARQKRKQAAKRKGATES